MLTFSIKPAGVADTADFHGVMQASYDNLENKELYVCDDEDFVRNVLADKNKGFGLIACADIGLSDSGKMQPKQHSEAAGVLLVTFPGDSDENLAGDILGADEDLTEIFASAGSVSENPQKCRQKILMSTAHIETTAVKPEFQGNGLQSKMISAALDYIAANYGNIKYVCATVSPDNTPSLKSFIKCGFNIVLTKKKYGGKMRHILVTEVFYG
jgi:ribosomal protein S18 acetylase RimI-like enzyme